MRRVPQHEVDSIQPLKQQETVIIEEKRSPAHAQSYGLDTEDLERTPGGFDDPIRLIQSLPGSVGTREYGPNAGSVILRGAAPTESRLYIDGVEVPHLYHFDQYASIFPTKMVDNVLIYPSNWDLVWRCHRRDCRFGVQRGDQLMFRLYMRRPT